LRADSTVITLTPRIFRLAAEALGANPKRCCAAGCLERFHVEGVPFLLAYFGAPAASMLLEVLAASGARRVVVLGEAGSISPRPGSETWCCRSGPSGRRERATTTCRLRGLPALTKG